MNVIIITINSKYILSDIYNLQDIMDIISIKENMNKHNIILFYNDYILNYSNINENIIINDNSIFYLIFRCIKISQSESS